MNIFGVDFMSFTAGAFEQPPGVKDRLITPGLIGRQDAVGATTY